MKIAVVHSEYANGTQSGENVVVAQQVEALAQNGYEVEVFFHRSSHADESPFRSLLLGLQVSANTGASPLDWLAKTKPDIIHVHNTFPHIGTRWISRVDIPIVATVHNYRTFCAAGTIFREGGECTSCLRSSFNAVKFSCYRNSHLASLPLAIANRGGVADSYLNLPNVSPIFLSKVVQDKFLSLGLSNERYFLIPNFVHQHPVLKDSVNNFQSSWIYAGRLTWEKGILELLRAWPSEEVLDVYGDGPLREEVESFDIGKNIRYHGPVDHDFLLGKLSHAQGLLLPSLWSEGAVPTVALEALALGLPVITLPGNSASDVISVSGAGLVLNSLAGLNLGLRDVRQNREKMSQNSLRLYESDFSKHSWLTKIGRAYESLIGK